MCHVKLHCVAGEPNLIVTSRLSLIWKIHKYRTIMTLMTGPGKWK